MQRATPALASDNDTPIALFNHSHSGILRALRDVEQLPSLAQAAEQARTQAQAALRFFDEVVLAHHQDEERSLFPAVLASAAPGDESQHVRTLVERLTNEHRQVESRWRALTPDVKKMAKGQACSLHNQELSTLLAAYQAHAAFEETEFLPLCQRILSRNPNHLAAMGLSLHVRHLNLPDSPT